MNEKRSQQYGPIFGVQQYPPEERGPWARARRQREVRLRRYRTEPAYRLRVRDRDNARNKALTKMCARCQSVPIRAGRVTCLECTRALKRRSGWYERARIELSHHAYDGTNKRHEARVRQLEQLRKEKPL